MYLNNYIFNIKLINVIVVKHYKYSCSNHSKSLLNGKNIYFIIITLRGKRQSFI